MEGVDEKRSFAFGVPVPRTPNQKPGIPPSHPNINIPPPTPYAQLRSPSSSHSRLSGRSDAPLGYEKPIQLVLKDSFKEGNGRKEEAADDLIREYMNLDNIDNINFQGMKDKDVDSRSSGSKSSDNEVESHGNGATSSCSNQRREGVKRNSNGDIAQTSRHRRSYSFDSFVGLTKLPEKIDQHSPSNSMDHKMSETATKLANGEFSAEELQKIMESNRLVEIASTDPKRAKRILANRQSAARSKEKKMRYIAELEHKVQTLQTETTTLSTQFNKLQRDNIELKNQNTEYKLRLQAIEHQSQLKDALKVTLDAEVRRLRRAIAELGGESLTNCMARQLAINQEMFELQHQQSSQQRHFLLQNHPTRQQTESQSHHIQGKDFNPRS
ncbi:hypothetical protein Fmac_000263 [Flemingia macrophylla]|uniref:BZIP domain-containing protein n=1 Tax=Flemingia macrophylla TaxID=520843 RepID=A0ABD1NFC8_9FABA